MLQGAYEELLAQRGAARPAVLAAAERLRAAALSQVREAPSLADAQEVSKLLQRLEAQAREYARDQVGVEALLEAALPVFRVASGLELAVRARDAASSPDSRARRAASSPNSSSSLTRGASELRPYVKRRASRVPDPSHRLLVAEVDDCVDGICVWLESQRDKGLDRVCNDKLNPEVGIKVLKELSGVVAKSLCFRLRSSYTFGFIWGKPHFWHLIDEYAFKKTASSMPGISLQKALVAIAKHPGVIRTDDARFRAFIFLGLSQGTLVKWLHILFGDMEAVQRYYDSGSLWSDAVSASEWLSALKPLQAFPWSLHLDFEREVKLKANCKSPLT